MCHSKLLKIYIFVIFSTYYVYATSNYKVIQELNIKSNAKITYVTLGSCWQFFTSLNDYTLMSSLPDPVHMHSEYKFGDCERKDKMFYTHVHLDHLQVLGKIIMRGWLDLFRIPTCIIIRAMAYETDLFRSTAYNFQMCVPRITYCHSKKRYMYYYYEWYIPADMIGGMNWDLYFYGPSSAEWQ